jgi:two-component system, OmpR family, phosphate regulon response regulator PhoB
MSREEGRKSVLIVDDDPCIRTNLVTLLEQEGWRTIEGTDGDDVVVKAVCEMPDLIILDVIMPRESGFDAYKELREDSRTESIPVILLTAINDESLGNDYDAEMVGEHLCVPPPEAFLEKPFDTDTILETVRGIMDERNLV